MGDLNQKLMNEIEYLSRLIDNHKSQATTTQHRQSAPKFSKFFIQRNLSTYRNNTNLKSNMLQSSRNRVQNGLFKKIKNPYKIDRTVNLSKSNNPCNKSNVGGKAFEPVTIPPVPTSIVKSEYKSTPKLQDFVKCSPIYVTIQEKSKLISVGHPSDKVKVSKTSVNDLPNISITKQCNNRLLKIKEKSPEKNILPLKNFPMSSNKIYSLSKPFIHKNDKAILKTKYKVVNCRKQDEIDNSWKHTLKRKQKRNTVYQRRNYVYSPWKLVYKNQSRVSGKYESPIQRFDYWRNPYYSHHRRYIKRNALHFKRWKKQSLASRRRIYTGTIAQQLKKNPILKSRMVMIGGLLYKASMTKLSRACKLSQNKQIRRNKTKLQTLLIRGVRYQMDSSGKVLKRLPNQPVNKLNTLGKNLKRIDLGGDTYIQTKPGVLMKTSLSQARTFVNRVVNRSINNVLAANQKKSRSKNNLYCTFYNRFGRCNKGKLCPYKHDPDKIAVCTRFLRGTCKVVDCPFSHKVTPEKMPVCSFYLQGRCNNDNCPYSHVKVNRSAEVCKDFLRGYCPAGEKCKKTHTLVCPEYLHKGICKNGEKCPMKHSKKGQKRKFPDQPKTQQSKKIAIESEDAEESNKSSSSNCEGSSKTHQVKTLSEQPAFISLGKYEEESVPLKKNTTIGKFFLLNKLTVNSV